MDFINEKVTLFEYICMFLFLFLSGSFWMISEPGIVRIGSFLVLDICLLLMRRDFLFGRKDVIVLLLVLFSLFINMEGLKNIVIYLVFFISAILFKRAFSLKKFLLVYVKTITITAVASVIMWVVAYVSPNLLDKLPQLTNSYDVSVWNAIVAVQILSSIRVQGFFWEPGAFQVFTGLAIIFLLFDNTMDIPVRKMRMMLLINIVAMGLTFSTTAYLSMICIFLVAFFSLKYKAMGKESRKKINIIIAIGIVIILVVINLPEWYKYLIFGKISAYINGGDANTASVYTRVDSVKSAVACFVKSPIWGVGEGKLISFMNSNYGHKNAVCTYLNMFAMFGLVAGMLMWKYLYCFFSKINDNKFVSIALFLTCGIMTFSENFIIVPVFLCLIFYGADFAQKDIYTYKINERVTYNE